MFGILSAVFGGVSGPRGFPLTTPHEQSSHLIRFDLTHLSELTSLSKRMFIWRNVQSTYHKRSMNGLKGAAAGIYGAVRAPRTVTVNGTNVTGAPSEALCQASFYGLERSP